MDENSSDDDVHTAEHRVKRRRLNKPLILDSDDEEHPSDGSQNDDWMHDRSKTTTLSTFSDVKSNKTALKPKHRIHVHENPADLEEQFRTQIADVSSSPWRIRGPIWKKPAESQQDVGNKPEDTGPAQVATYGSKSQRSSASSSLRMAAVPRRTTSTSGQNWSFSDSDDPFEPIQLSEPISIRAGNTAPSQNLDRCAPSLQTNLLPLSYDIAKELEDLPSDAFSSDTFSPIDSRTLEPSVVNGVVLDSAAKDRSPSAPQRPLRQMTLFGETAQADTSFALSTNSLQSSSDIPIAREEKPTHHSLDTEAAKTWIYPTNLGTIRDYQYNIVSKALFRNVLVALPTGLGKTFIAATVMLNWYRWTTNAQILFVAPTRPLVEQQVDACFKIAGIPRSDTTMMTGKSIAAALRAEEWATKRVFFMTAETVMIDLKRGDCDPKKIVLVVVDEAHRAKGNYAYVQLIKFIRKFNASFRVLALTATPGSSVDAVQEVIDGLGIARIEIRTEHSLDIRQFVHSKHIETLLFDESEEMQIIMDLFSKALQNSVNKLQSAKVIWNKDPMTLTAFGLTKARQKWSASGAGSGPANGHRAMLHSLFTMLSSLAHAIELLKFHGIVPFYHSSKAFRDRASSSNIRCEKDVEQNENFQKMMTKLQFWINIPSFIGHPKLEYLQEAVLKHFIDAQENLMEPEAHSTTRVMIFAHFRDSATEIVRVLQRHQPMIRPHLFVGQSSSKGSEGMQQKEQRKIVEAFREGTYNTLVATSIGEEGLDIGEIDLIICYDSSSSPVRMLQRMGRTGRKREGRVILLLMKEKEARAYDEAKDNYQKMQEMIAKSTRFSLHEDTSPRILPNSCRPTVLKKHVEIPQENEQASAQQAEPAKKQRKPTKRQPKKFHTPKDAQRGFIRASTLGAKSNTLVRTQTASKGKTQRFPLSKLQPIGRPEEVYLSQTECAELRKTYQNVQNTGNLAGFAPSLSSHVELQRTLRPIKYVNHSQLTSRVVRALDTMIKPELLDVFESLAESDATNKLIADRGPSHTDEKPQDVGMERVSQVPKPERPPRPRKTSGRVTVSRPTQSYEAVENEPSSAPATSPRMAIPSQGVDLGTQDTFVGSDGEETDSDLASFIVNDDDETLSQSRGENDSHSDAETLPSSQTSSVDDFTPVKRSARRKVVISSSQ